MIASLCRNAAVLLAATLAAGGVGAQQRSLQDLGVELAPLPAITIYTAREIVTMDPQKPTATAVAVVGDRILAVGTVAELQKAAGSQPHSVDATFASKVLTPGFIAQHMHPVLAALTMRTEIIAIEDWVLPSGTVPAVRDRPGYLKRLRDAEARLADPDTLLVTWGFHHYFHGKLTRADLDQVNARRPIIVWHRSAHEFFLNSAAMEKYGVNTDLVARMTPGAQQQSNLSEGHFWEQGMFAVMPRIAPAIATPDRLRSGLEFVKTYLQANGVTLGSEPGGVVSKPLQNAQNAVLGGADTPFRFYYIPDGKTMAELHVDGDLIGETRKLLDWGQGNTSFLPQQAKLFADGAIFSQAMQLRDGYLDGHKGEWMQDPARFAKAFARYWDAGYQIHIHQNGDLGLDMVLDNLEAAMRRNPRYDHRTVIAHFGFATRGQVERIGRLGAIVSANPYYVSALADKYGELGVGPQRADEMVRLGDVERAGVSFSLHDDMPMAPAQPLFLMHAAVNRTTFSGRVAGPEQRVSREAALRAVTIDAAYALRLEKEVGSIEPGKRASFTVLDANPLTVPAATIKDVKVWGTVHEGRIFPVAPATPGARLAAPVGPTERWIPANPIQAVLSGEAHNAVHHGDLACRFSQLLASSGAWDE